MSMQEVSSKTWRRARRARAKFASAQRNWWAVERSATERSVAIEFIRMLLYFVSNRGIHICACVRANIIFFVRGSVSVANNVHMYIVYAAHHYYLIINEIMNIKSKAQHGSNEKTHTKRQGRFRCACVKVASIYICVCLGICVWELENKFFLITSIHM